MTRFCSYLRSRQFTILVSLAMVVLASGCVGYIDRQAAKSTYGIVKNSKRAMQGTTDVEFARLAIPGGLVQLEAFHLAYPNHRGFLKLLSEGQCQYAMGFVYGEWELDSLSGDGRGLEQSRPRALAALERCRTLGLELLGSRWQGLESLEEWQTALASAKKKHVPGLTWVALAMTNTIAIDPLKPQRLGEIKVVESLLETVVALDEGYDNAIAHVMLGALACSRPRLLGGNSELGREHFDKARTLAGPEVHMTDVIFARTCAVAIGDRNLFKKTLGNVARAQTPRSSELSLANALARQKARLYLDSEAMLFGPES